MKNLTRNIIIAIVIFLLISIAFSLFNTSESKVKDINITTFISEIEAGQIQSAVIKDSQIDLTLKDGSASAVSDPLSITVQP